MKTPERINWFVRIIDHHRSVTLLALLLTFSLVLPLARPVRSEVAAATDTIIRTPAGSGFFGFSGDGGAATSARFSTPNGVALDAVGNLYVADLYNDRIRKIDTSGMITSFAGKFGGTAVGDGGPATEAGLFDPAGVAVDEKGNVYIADMDNNKIRKVDTTGKITTVAGNGNFGYTGDNVTATQTALSSPAAVAVDAAGNLYIADLFNSRIRKVNPQGVITTLAGTGTAGNNGDGGQATQARIDTPESIAVDALGNLYLADSASHVVRRVDTMGSISTFAGTGQDGFSGDNGQARQARLSSPRGVAADAAGNLYIADAGNDRIRRVDPGGIIITLAGNGQTGYSGDGGLATQASFFEPVGLALDPYGVVYLADSYNDRIRMLKSTQLQFFGLSRYVLPAGGTQATLNLIGTGLENSSVTINSQSVTSTLDQATGNLSVTLPISLTSAPNLLSFQISKPPSQTSAVRKVVVTTPAQLNSVAPVTVGAASYQALSAPESISAMFGVRLATQFGAANTLPLPTTLAGTTALINGMAAPLFFVSPNQINYQIPQELAAGAVAALVIMAGDGMVAQGQLQVTPEAPGVFTANASGSGGPAAVWTVDGVNYQRVVNNDGTLRPILAGAFVVLFTTGVRHTAAANPTDANGVAESLHINLGGTTITPLFAGPQGSLVGLDQINLQIPANLAGRGKVDLTVTANTRSANTVQLQIM